LRIFAQKNENMEKSEPMTDIFSKRRELEKPEPKIGIFSKTENRSLKPILSKNRFCATLASHAHPTHPIRFSFIINANAHIPGLFPA
jgi:hypothetical protein